MRALSFFFALMVGLVLAFFAPAMAGGPDQAPGAVLAPEVAVISTESADLLGSDGVSVDQLTADLLAELSIDLAPTVDAAALDVASPNAPV